MRSVWEVGPRGVLPLVRPLCVAAAASGLLGQLWAVGSRRVSSSCSSLLHSLSAGRWEAGSSRTVRAVHSLDSSSVTVAKDDQEMGDGSCLFGCSTDKDVARKVT
jgi:hypothetical protein